jgi:dipeptidyl aminopeptidase/acylaminoacyl peptidase
MPDSMPAYTLQQFMAIKRANGPAFSPGAERISFATNASGNWQVWVTPIAAWQPKQLTEFAAGTSSPHWSPKGEAILVMVDHHGDRNSQLLTVDARTGASTALTRADSVRHNFGGWMPDGRSIFYTSNARDRRYFDCYVMDVATQRAELVCQRPAMLRAMAASPDGRLLAVEDVRSEVDNDILIVDRSTGTARNLTPHKGAARFAVIGFSHDDQTLYCRSNVEGEYMGIVAVSVDNGARRPLITASYDIDYAVVDRQGTRMAFSENVNGFERLALCDAATGRRLPLPELPQGINTPREFSGDGSKLAIVVSTPDHDDEAWVIDIKAQRATRVTYSPQGGVAEGSCIPARSIHYPSFDGRSIPALLFMPRDSSPRLRAPVVLSVHGGPEEQEQPYLTNFYQVLLARGYAVLAPNVRGSTGYGKSYTALDNGPLRWDALKDVAWAVRWIRSQKDLDADKVACFGPSYGGFITLAMLAHYPDLFRAGVDFYGPADLGTFLGRTAEYRRLQRIAEYGDPVRDSVFMAAISPARHAGHIRSPLLVVQGKNDPVVPPSESEDIVRLVRAGGGTAEYLLFPDEGHGLAKESNYVKAFETMVEFLVRHMPPGR